MFPTETSRGCSPREALGAQGGEGTPREATNFLLLYSTALRVQGGSARQGAASVRARCPRRRGARTVPGSPAEGGGSPAWRGISRRTDRSADGCADWRTFCDSLSASQVRWPPCSASSEQRDEGSSRPWAGHTAAAVTTQVRVLPTRSYPHVLGKRGRTRRSTAAVRGTWVGAWWREQEGERFGAVRQHAVVGVGATTRPVSPSRPDHRGCRPEERGERSARSRRTRPLCPARHGAARGRDAARLAVPLLGHAVTACWPAACGRTRLTVQ